MTSAKDRTSTETKDRMEQLDTIITFLNKGALHEAAGAFRRSYLTPTENRNFLKPKVLEVMRVLLDRGEIVEAANAVFDFDLKDLTFDEMASFKPGMIKAVGKLLEEESLDKATNIILGFGIKREELEASLIQKVVSEIDKLMDGAVLESGDEGFGIACTAAAAFRLTKEDISGLGPDKIEILLSVLNLPSKEAEPKEQSGLQSLRRQDEHTPFKAKHQTQNS